MVLAVCERGYVIVYVIYVMQFGLCYWSFVICGYVILVVCDVKLWCRGHVNMVMLSGLCDSGDVSGSM